MMNEIERITDEEQVLNTGLKGYISATQRELESAFGTPTSEIINLPPGKSTVEFWLKINGEVVVIYDWKEDTAPGMDDVIHWHVAGNDYYSTDQLINVGFDQDKVWTRAEYTRKLFA